MFRVSRWANKSAKHDTGLSLVELVVAVAVLAIGTLATLQVTGQSRVVLGQAKPRVLAQLAAENRAEELRLHGLNGARGLPSEVRQGDVNIALRVETLPTQAGLVEARVIATHPQGVGAVLVLYLAPGAP